MRFKLLLPNSCGITPIEGHLMPHLDIPDLEAFATLRAELPLQDNRPWLLFDTGAGRVAEVSPVLDAICSAAELVYGQNPLHVWAEQRRIVNEINVLPPLTIPCKKGEYRIAFCADQPDSLLFPGGQRIAINAVITLHGKDGRELELPAARVKWYDPYRLDLYTVDTPKGALWLTSVFAKKPLAAIDRLNREAGNPPLAEQLIAAMADHLEQLDALLYRPPAALLVIGPDSPLAGLWHDHLYNRGIDGSLRVAPGSTPRRLELEGEMSRTFPVDNLGLPPVSYYASERLALTIDRETSIALMKEAGIADVAGLLTHVIGRYSRGELPYWPSLHRLELTVIEFEDGTADLAVPGCHNPDPALEAIGRGEFRRTDKNGSSPSRQLAERLERLAATPGTADWFKKRRTEFADSSAPEEIPFGDGRLLSLEQAVTGDACALRVGFRLASEPRDWCRLLLPRDLGDVAFALRGCLNIANYRAWVENHPDGEPQFVEDAIAIRLEATARQEEALASEIVSYYQPVLDAFCAAHAGGEAARLTLPEATFDAVSPAQLCPGIATDAWEGYQLVTNHDGTATLSLAA